MLDDLVLTLLSIEAGDVAVSLTSNMEFRDKIQVALAVGLKNRLDDEWYEVMSALLIDIDNRLRLQRNRFVHDFWTMDGVQVKKLQFKVTLKRPQSRKPLELTTRHETHVTPQEIWDVAEAVNLAAGHVALSAQAFRIYTRRALQRK
jgi:hypothetical protein